MRVAVNLFKLGIERQTGGWGAAEVLANTSIEHDANSNAVGKRDKTLRNTPGTASILPPCVLSGHATPSMGVNERR